MMDMAHLGVLKTVYSCEGWERKAVRMDRKGKSTRRWLGMTHEHQIQVLCVW